MAVNSIFIAMTNYTLVLVDNSKKTNSFQKIKLKEVKAPKTSQKTDLLKFVSQHVDITSKNCLVDNKTSQLTGIRHYQSIVNLSSINERGEISSYLKISS